MQLLHQVDWRTKGDVLRKHIAAGHDVILLGEDLCRDPASGLPVDPINCPAYDRSTDAAAGGRSPNLPPIGIRKALRQIAGPDWLRLWPHGPARVVPLGRGRLIVDPTSFDNAGSANTLFADQWSRWRDRLRRALSRRAPGKP